jgi:hypothetical protein
MTDELVDAVRRARAWLAPDGELQEPFDPSVQELS